MSGGAANGPNRRDMVAALVLVAAAGSAQPRPAPVRSSSIRWSGANGRTLHGFMAIPGKARGRQPAVLVIAGATALPPVPDPVARTIVAQIANAGLLACTADNITGLADLQATVAWLRFNQYATGRVALVGAGLGTTTATRLAAVGEEGVAALLLLGDVLSPASPVPALALDWRPDDPVLPAGAIPFLKDHLA